MRELGRANSENTSERKRKAQLKTGEETGWGSTVLELTTNGGFVLYGRTETLLASKSITIMAEYIEIEHPGVILKEEFLDPLNITQSQLSEVAGIPKGRVSEIVHGKRAITAETGIRISRALGLSDNFFYGLQTDYNSRLAQRTLDSLGVNVVSVVS